jgi:hypothetical protein
VSDESQKHGHEQGSTEHKPDLLGSKDLLHLSLHFPKPMVSSEVISETDATILLAL